MKERLLDLLAQSVLISGTIALLMVITCCYLWASGKPVPQELFTFMGIILAWFFGAKTGRSSK